MEGDNKV